MISEAAVWAIFFLPIGALAVIAFIIRPLFNQYSRYAGYVLILALTGSLALSIWALHSVTSNGEPSFQPHQWLVIGGLEIRIGLMLNSLTAVMLLVVTGVSLMVQIYSQSYMKGDSGYARYFAFMGLFSAAMLGLVLSSNIIQLYVMWELVGLGSYLLIGFWHHRPAAAAAAKKAFLVTRVGDFGFLLAILYLFFNNAAFAEHGLNPLEIADIYKAVPLIENGALAALGGLGLTWVAVGIFFGAAGKSAQFPLHVWLPDAMEGPTPVSALIHAATMVAAGVFLVARFFPIFQASSEAMSAVAIVGAFTAVFAATMGLVANDIKRVLAFSTISQLGYMMAALGVGAYGPAVFHLFNHAFFKALLFLGAGSVNHATGTFDMRYMGGLRKTMPWTYAGMLIGSLSLVGIFPLAGFWSKDEILNHAWHGVHMVDNMVFWLLIVGVALTAFYTFRMMYMTFHGQFNGGISREIDQGQTLPDVQQGKQVHLAESPITMLIPMGILAIAAVISGYLVNPLQDWFGVPHHWLTEFLHVEALGFNFWLALVTMLVALVMIGLATIVYLKGYKPSDAVLKALGLPKRVLAERYFIDQLYERGLVKQGLYRTISRSADWMDSTVVDGIVDLSGLISRNLGRLIGRLQTGQVQGHVVGISGGALVILLIYLVWG